MMVMKSDSDSFARDSDGNIVDSDGERIMDGRAIIRGDRAYFGRMDGQEAWRPLAEISEMLATGSES